MGGRFLRPGANIPQSKPTSSYLNVYGKKGLSDGEHYFILGVGQIDDGVDFWRNEDFSSPTSAVPKFMCQFWMHEMNDGQGGYARWLYTGDNDPIVALGLHTTNQSKERIKQIYGDKASPYITTQPQNEYVLPVVKVDKKGKSFDIENGEYHLMVLRENSLNDIIEAGKTFSMENNSSLYGRVLILKKNLGEKDPKKIYSFSFITLPPQSNSEMDEKFAQMREKAIEDIDRVFIEANGGDADYNPEFVWKYLTNQFGGTRDELLNKYNVSTQNLELSLVEEVEI